MELAEILNNVYPQLVMLACIYALVLFVIFLDLWAGIRKARQRGEFRSSFGLRKTVEKVGKYFNMIFVITVIDGIQMLAITQLNAQITHQLPVIPFLTFIGAIFVGFIELKSIYEKAGDKEKAKINEAAKLAGQIMADRSTQEIAAKVIEYLKTEKQEGGQHGECK